MRLLVVEDDKDLNRQLVAALEQAGYAVDRAFDGEEGWFLGDTEPYDAVILISPKRAGDERLLAALRPLIGSISVEAMRSANYAVDRDQGRVSPAEAARALHP